MRKMIKIAICDDEEIVTSDIEERLRRISQKSDVSIDIDIFFDGTTLTDYIINNSVKYDLIYLDIELKNENGVDTARKIRQFDKDFLLIYITNYESFAKEVFEVSAYRFITKPIPDDLFERYFESAVDKITKAPQFFQFQYNKVHYKLPLDDIMYFQSDRRVTYINTGTDSKKCYEKLNAIEQKLQQNGVRFFRTHQSFLVNPSYVEVYMYDSMQLRDKTVLSISEKRRKAVSELYCKMKGDSIIV